METIGFENQTGFKYAFLNSQLIIIIRQCTLLVLIDFCLVWSEFLTCLPKTFDILPEIIMEYQI